MCPDRLLRAMQVFLVCGIGVLPVAAEQFADALLRGANDPALAEQAASSGDAALLSALGSADADERRGAARLLAWSGIEPEQILAHLLASDDGELRRLGARALLGRSEGIAAADLLALDEPGIVLPLLMRHPAPDPLADAAVRDALVGWLSDSEHGDQAAALIAARGSVAHWGERLVGLVEDPGSSEAVVAAAHHALELLTHEQRNRAVYVGHRSLLARDWRDTLSRLGAEGSALSVDEALVERARELPDEAVLLELLARPDEALPAVEQLLDAGASGEAEAQLKAAARLLARRVSPTLYQELDAAVLDGMDAPDPDRRIASLQAAVAVVRDSGDALGLRHILTYGSDRDDRVAARAFDALTRLSDERRSNDWNWRLYRVFPEADTTWRLRAALNEGNADVRISAMQFIATMEAGVYAPDILRQLSAADGTVVETAMETLNHLDLDPQSRHAFVGMIVDADQPATRRARLLEILMDDRKAMRDGGIDPADWTRLREALSTVEDDLVRQGLARILSRAPEGGAAVEAYIQELLDSDEASKRLQAISLLQDEMNDIERLSGFLFAEDAVVATAAREAVIEMDGSSFYDERRLPLSRVDGAAVAAAARQGDDPQLWSIALRQGGIPWQEALDAFAERPALRQAVLFRSLLVTIQGVAEVDRLLGLVADMPDEDWAGSEESWRLLQPLITNLVGLEDDLAAEIALSGTDYWRTRGSSHSGRGVSVRLRLPGEPRLVLQERPGEDDAYTITGLPSDWSPDAAMLQTWAEQLAAAPVPEDLHVWRHLIICLIRGETPDPEQMAAGWSYQTFGLVGVLLRRHPELRAPLISGLREAGEVDSWDLRQLIAAGNPDCALLVLSALNAQDSNRQYVAREFNAYLDSLSEEDLSAALRDFAATDPEAIGSGIINVLRGRTLPMGLALDLLANEAWLVPEAVAPATEAEAAQVDAALRGLDRERVLRRLGLLRQIIAAAPEASRASLAAIVAAADERAAVWLRSGLPLELEMEDAYRAAWASDLPALWLVGAAYRAARQELSAADFLAGVGERDVVVMDARNIFYRYYADEVREPAVDSALAERVREDAALPAIFWALIAPPGPETSAALAARSAEADFARELQPRLRARLQGDAAAWSPVARACITAAGGVLDDLQPLLAPPESP